MRQKTREVKEWGPSDKPEAGLGDNSRPEVSRGGRGRAGSRGEIVHTVSLEGWDQQPCHVFRSGFIGCKVDEMADASGVRVDEVQTTLPSGTGSRVGSNTRPGGAELALPPGHLYSGNIHLRWSRA